MLLLLCATEIEKKELVAAGFKCFQNVQCLVTGVGPVETTLQLCSFLATAKSPIDRVIVFGVGGAYCSSGVGLLDVCVADKEIFGDLGICQGEGVIPFEGGGFAPPREFSFSSPFLDQCLDLLERQNIDVRKGAFVTVSGVSSTRSRGDFFSDRYGAICENMEGAAVARVCGHFSLPLVEIRAISNMVEDRDASCWRIRDAARKAAEAAFVLARHPW